MSRSPLRVAVASSGLGHVARGVEAWAADLGAALESRGVDVTLYQGGGETRGRTVVLPCLQRESARNARVRRRIPRSLGWRLGLGDYYALEQSTFAWSLWRALRRNPVDILHVQDPIIALRFEQLRRLGLTKTRTILAHGTEEPPEFLARFRYVQHLAPTHLDACRAAGVWRPTWTAIANFVDVEHFRPDVESSMRTELNIPAGARVVLTAAAIRRSHKRIDWLCQALAAYRVAHPEVPVVLVVAGAREPDTEAIMAEAKALLGDSVRFLVSYPRARMAELFRAADVFTLPSLFEMLGIVLLEASASGVPCLVHDAPIFRWVTGPGGVAIDMRDTHAFSDALHQLLIDDEYRTRLARAGREHTVAEFSADAIVDRIVQYYHAVMADRP